MTTHGVLSLACERCKKRKQKCDRRTPTCGECLRGGADCTRSAREADAVRGPDGSVQLKSPVTILHERLAELESLAAERGLVIDSDANDGTGPGPAEAFQRHVSNIDAGPESAEAMPWGQVQSDRRSERAHTQSNTQRGLDLLSLGAMAEPTRRTGEMLRELSIPRLIFAVTEVFGGDPERTRRVDRLWDCVARDIKRPGLNPDRLHIPQAEASDCMLKYFKLVDYRYPSLRRDDVEDGLATICRDMSGSESDMQAKSATSFIAYMVVAIVPLVADDYSSVHGSFVSIHMLSRALQLLEDIFRSDDGVEIIQCLRLLVVFTLQNSAAGSSWHLIGFAMKKCIALGYHLEPDEPSTAKERENQERSRWLFWSCYMLDRLICTALGRPYSIDDAYITVKMPDSTSSGRLRGAAARQVHLFRYARLMSEITRDRAAHSYRYHLSRLVHWRCTAPEHVEPYPPEQRSHLKSIYDTLLLRVMIDRIVHGGDASDKEEDDGICLRGSSNPNATPLNASNNPDDSLRDTDILATCQAVVSSLTRVTMRDRAFLPWLTGYSAFSAALVLLYLQAKTRFAASPNAGVMQSDNWPTGALTESPFDYSYGSVTRDEDHFRDAVAVMAIVGRQFTRIAKYKAFVIKLRNAMSSPTPQNMILEQAGMLDVLDDSSPDHLYRLAKATVLLMRRRETQISIPNE